MPPIIGDADFGILHLQYIHGAPPFRALPVIQAQQLLRRATKLEGLATMHITEGASYRRARKQQRQRKDRDLLVVSSYLA
jgi:hypothetical protein